MIITDENIDESLIKKLKKYTLILVLFMMTTLA